MVSFNHFTVLYCFRMILFWNKFGNNVENKAAILEQSIDDIIGTNLQCIYTRLRQIKRSIHILEQMVQAVKWIVTTHFMN